MTTPRSTPAGVTAAGRDRFGQSSSGRRPGSSFGAIGALAGVVIIALVVGGIVWAAATGKAPASQKPKIFGGSLVLDDYRPLTVIDLATGEVTVQLEGVYAQVGATNYGDVQAVATEDGTTLVNRRTGTFNMLGNDDYVLGPTNNGISLGGLPGASRAAGFSDGSSTYILRYGPTSTVSLVDSSTAVAGAQALATRSAHTVRPLGFVHVTSRLANVPGGATVNKGHLWVLASAGENCQLVQVTPTPQHLEGLSATRRSALQTACSTAALESSAGTVGLMMPGRVELFEPHGVVKDVNDPATATATAFMPVEGSDGELWYLARLPSGWSVVGVNPNGQVTSPLALRAFGPDAQPAVPAFSAGRIYTLDQAQPGQPTLWTINPGTGAMGAGPWGGQVPRQERYRKGQLRGRRGAGERSEGHFQQPTEPLGRGHIHRRQPCPCHRGQVERRGSERSWPRRCERQAIKDKNDLTTGHQYADNYRNDCRATHHPTSDSAGKLRRHHRETLRAPSELHLRVG